MDIRCHGNQSNGSTPSDSSGADSGFLQAVQAAAEHMAPRLRDRIVTSQWAPLLRLNEWLYTGRGGRSDGPKQTGPFAYGVSSGRAVIRSTGLSRHGGERVLNVDPPIPFFHAAEIRNRKWQAKSEITATNAERRIDEAVRDRECGKHSPTTNDI